MFAVFAGCSAEDDLDRLMKPQWKPELAVPVINTKLSIDEVLDSHDPGDFVEVGQDGLITLVYEDLLYSKQGNELLPLQNLLLHFADSSGFMGFHIGDHQLDYLEFLSGQLKILLEEVLGGRSGQSLHVEVSIPQLSKNGQPFQKSYDIDYSGGRQVLEDLNLSGYRLTFDHGEMSNGIQLFIAVKDQFGNTVTTQFSHWLEFSDMLFSYVEGRFGDLDLGFKPDTIPLHIFRNWKSGTVVLHNPRIRLVFTNSFGLPITGSLVLLEGYSGKNGGIVVPLQHTSGLENGFILNYPSVGEILDIVESSFVLDGTNSNISNVLSISPSQLRFNFYFLAEGEVQTEDVSYFIKNDSRLDFRLQVELPMSGKLQNILLQDTFQIDASTREMARNTDNLSLRLETENFLPIDLSLQLFMLDHNGNFLDSLLIDPTLLLSGKVDNQGRVVEATIKQTGIPLEGHVLSSFSNTDRLVLQVRVRTSSGGMEENSFYSDYYLGLKLGMMAKTQLN